MRQWQEQIPRTKCLTISVNLSGKHISQPDIFPFLEKTLRQTGLDPACLKIELTESSIIENNHNSTLVFEKLKAMGVQIHIDDFGVGYSSLSYLSKYPIDALKLENLLRSLANGSLRHADVFGDHGHGALVYDPRPLPLDDSSDFGVVVTGPRRSMLRESSLRPYFAVPFGDMMIAGCFGLLSATAALLPELAEQVRGSLSMLGITGLPPWETE